jgi:hypothetical protein
MLLYSFDISISSLSTDCKARKKLNGGAFLSLIRSSSNIAWLSVFLKISSSKIEHDDSNNSKEKR